MDVGSDGDVGAAVVRDKVGHVVPVPDSMLQRAWLGPTAIVSYGWSWTFQGNPFYERVFSQGDHPFVGPLVVRGEKLYNPAQLILIRLSMRERVTLRREGFF